MFYLKYLIFSLICSFSSFADNSPSFSFSEKEGLKPLSKNNPTAVSDDFRSQKSMNANKQPNQPKLKKSQELKIKTLLEKEGIKKTEDQSKNITLDKNLEEAEKEDTIEEAKKENTIEEAEKETNLKHSSLNTEDKKATQNSISETFAPQKEKQPLHQLNSFLNNSSWFFQNKPTKHKVALVPIYSYDKTESSRFGIRFFSFSPEEKGYYFAMSGAKYWPKNYYSSSLTYKSKRHGLFRSELSLTYDDHYENYYGSLRTFEGMNAPLDELQKLEAHRMMIDYNLFYQEKDKFYYLGLGTRAFFRQERKYLQENNSYFPSEYFIFLRVFAGRDTRDNWKYPKKGVFHQASIGCKASLVFSSAYCQTHGDLRFYNSLSKKNSAPNFIQNTVLSLRIFYGTSLINSSSYATKYSLGGKSFFQQLDFLRGFKNRRFLGDKIYLGQSELKVPIWKEYLILALFFEMGEVTQFEKSFDGFVTNYGGGVRIGWPKDTGMKIRLDYSRGKDRQNQTNTDFIISFLQAF